LIPTYYLKTLSNNAYNISMTVHTRCNGKLKLTILNVRIYSKSSKNLTFVAEVVTSASLEEAVDEQTQ